MPVLAGTLKTYSGVEFGRWMCQILLEQQVMVTHARCRLAAAGLKSPAAGSLSPPPNVGLKGCLCGTHEDTPNSKLGDIHTAVSLAPLFGPSLSQPEWGWGGGRCLLHSLHCRPGLVAGASLRQPSLLGS